jgi:uncharacterized protein YecT (DUF1311 family)
MRTRLPLSLALAAAAAVSLAINVPAGAAPARAAKLSPPVIHESFTPLPCAGSPGHRSTLQEEGCAEQQILGTDKQIDGLNGKIFGKLSNARARRDLVAGHKAWLSYRRAYCLSVSDVFQGGTQAAVVDADCVAGVNAQHVRDLTTFLGDLSAN